ncbi:hypothetical protein D3C72_1743680 [compost metagenome]
MIPEGAADNHGIADADILRRPVQVGRDHPDTGGIDKHFVGCATLHYLGIPGGNANTGLLRGGGHRGDHAL